MMQFQRRRKRQALGINDFLTYLMLYDACTVLHKDSALSMHFSYQPPDLESSTDVCLDAYSAVWRQAFSFLGDGWMVETNLVSRQFSDPTPKCDYPDLVSSIIEDERRQISAQGHYFNSEFILSISYKAPSAIASKFRQFAMDDHVAEMPFESEIMHFKNRVDEFTAFLGKAMIIKPLQGEDLISFLYQSLSGLEHRLVPPFQGGFLDCYLSNSEFYPGDKPMIGDQHIRVLAIDELPSDSYPCILDLLSHFPVAYRWSSRFICLDKLSAGQYLKRYERSWSSKAIGLLGVVKESLGMVVRLDRDAERTAEQLRESQADNASGYLGYGFYNSVIVLMDADPGQLEHLATEIKNQIQQLNFRVRVESINSTDAYIGSLPGHGEYNVRKMMVDTQFVSHVLPMSGLYQGEHHAPCPYYGVNRPPLLLCGTQGSRPFWLNLHVNDVGHTAILGPTGSGKSTLIAALMVAHRQYRGSRIIVLDKDFSHRVLIQALGGQYFDITTNDCQLAPLARLTPDDFEGQAMVSSWLSECCDAQGVVMTPQHHKAIQDAVMFISHEEPKYKTLQHLCLQEAELRAAIDVYANGEYQSILNGAESIMQSSSVIGFEMSGLISSTMSNANKVMPVIKALINELECSFRDKRPTLLILEEAWLYLRHPIFREKLTDWFKTLRKFNVAVIFVSQDLSDIAHSDAASVIQNSCMTRIYLPNKSASEPAAKIFYENFGLNDRQIELIKEAVPKQDYYYSSPLGNRLFRLNLGHVAKSFLCVSSKEQIKAFQDIYNKENNQWILEWLEKNQLPDWRGYVEANYFE